MVMRLTDLMWRSVGFGTDVDNSWDYVGIDLRRIWWQIWNKFMSIRVASRQTWEALRQIWDRFVGQRCGFGTDIRQFVADCGEAGAGLV